MPADSGWGDSRVGLGNDVDLSAYRIAQEALTNALKHSGDKKTRLQVTSRPTLVSIRSENARGGRGTALAPLAATSPR